MTEPALWTAALPPVAATLLLAAVMVAELAGAHPMTYGAPRTPAEAIALHDHAALLRLVAQPDAADRVAMVRTDLLGDRVMFTTPAEAAVLAHDRGALDLLATHGAHLDAEREQLVCLARDVHDTVLASFLASSSTVTCAWDDGMQRVLRRP